MTAAVTAALLVVSSVAGASAAATDVVVADPTSTWDAASNLTGVTDARDPLEWPHGYRPQTLGISHDALYRVTRAACGYSQDSGSLGADTVPASDWRAERTRTNDDGDRHLDADPMREKPVALRARRGLSVEAGGGAVR